jgi:ATP-dependent DNA helicase 2 subunit 1
MEEDNEAIAKRAKTDAGSGEADVRALWEKGPLEKLTVGILKGFLRRMGLSVKGKEADLLKRCEEYFNGEGVNTAE